MYQVLNAVIGPPINSPCNVPQTYSHSIEQQNHSRGLERTLSGNQPGGKGCLHGSFDTVRLGSIPLHANVLPRKLREATKWVRSYFWTQSLLSSSFVAVMQVKEVWQQVQVKAKTTCDHAVTPKLEWVSSRPISFNLGEEKTCESSNICNAARQTKSTADIR